MREPEGAWGSDHTEAMADLVVAWSLGLASPEDGERAAAHAETCPGCASLARAGLVTGAGLAAETPPVEASDLLLARILQSTAGVPVPTVAPGAGRSRLTGVLALAAAVVVGLVAAGGVISLVVLGSLQDGRDQALAAVLEAVTAGTAWTIPATAVAPSTQLVLAPAGDAVQVLFQADPAPSGHHYTLWVATTGEPYAVTSLGTGQGGPALVRVPVGMGQVSAAMVTIEPDGMLAGPAPGPEVAFAKRP